MANLAFLADDLTGALDAGVQLLDFGYTVSVCLAHGDLTAETADILVLDSESRNILPAAAAEQVRRGLALLQAAGRHLVYKKIDSTLRGNIGSELAALLDATWCDGILIAPALPAQGRTTRDGIHFVQGLPLAQTELARDPFAPILSSRIAEIIASQSDRPTAEIPLAYVRGPAPALKQLLRNHIFAGRRLLVCDAETDADLSRLSAAAAELPLRLVGCGSAGLARHYLPVRTAFTPDWPMPRSGRPLLVLSGSPAQMAKEQIRLAVQCRPDLVLVRAGLDQLASEPALLETAVTALRQGRSVIVDAAGSSKADILRQTRDDRAGLEQDSRRIQTFLARLAAEAIREDPAGLVLFGGDTVASVFRALQAQSIRLAGQIEPQVCLGSLSGGLADALPVVTKAGGFGRPGTLLEWLDRLVPASCGGGT